MEESEITPEIREQARKAWVAALRSGEFEQGKNYLCSALKAYLVAVMICDRLPG